MKLQNNTEKGSGLHGRWYDDACGAAFAMELLGERWSLLIVRELMFGPRRFSDLRASLPSLSAKVLSERLSGLAATGILVNREMTEPVPASLYELTPWGYRAEPIIQELGRWAAASPLHDPTLPLSPASFMLSLRTMLDHEAAKALSATIAFSIGTARFTARLTGGEMPVTRGETDAADLRFVSPSGPALAAVFYGGVDPADVGVAVDGDPDLQVRFQALFELPQKISDDLRLAASR